VAEAKKLCKIRKWNVENGKSVVRGSFWNGIDFCGRYPLSPGGFCRSRRGKELVERRILDLSKERSCERTNLRTQWRVRGQARGIVSWWEVSLAILSGYLSIVNEYFMVIMFE
jgi:hypothetical protein